MRKVKGACLASTLLFGGAACAGDTPPVANAPVAGTVGFLAEALTAGEPSAGTLEAMAFGLDDGYLARATYQAVIDRFGEVRPFINIIQAEERHIQMILQLYADYGIRPPADRHRGSMSAPSTLQQACENAVQAERDNAALYDDVLQKVDDANVYEVLSRLRAASVNNHLPAFQRCVDRNGSGGGAGAGARQGGGGFRYRGGRG